MYDHPNICTVTFTDGSIAKYTDNILTSAQAISPIREQPILPLWIKGGVNATLFFDHMSKPRHGVYLYQKLMAGTSIQESQRKEYYYQI